MKLHANYIRSRGRRRARLLRKEIVESALLLLSSHLPHSGCHSCQRTSWQRKCVWKRYAFHMCSAVYAGEEHKATQDMWLSPQSRLLADSPEGADYVFDGQGHRLIFPEGLNEGETLPLIIIGVGKSLQLKDVKLVHAASLPACIQLGSGMLLVTFPASSL